MVMKEEGHRNMNQRIPVNPKMDAQACRLKIVTFTEKAYRTLNMFNFSLNFW
jgi:hypothetical protein